MVKALEGIRWQEGIRMELSECTESMKIFVFHGNANQKLLTVNVNQHLFSTTSVLALWVHELNSNGNRTEVMNGIKTLGFF